MTTEAREQRQTITFRSSMGWEPQRFQERPRDGFEAFQFDGEVFPLQFLRKGEGARLTADDTSNVAIYKEDESERWDVALLRPGHWLVRNCDRGDLIAYSPENFEAKFVETTNDPA